MANILIALPRDILGGAEQILKMITRQHLLQGDQVDIFFINERKAGQWEDLPEGASLVYGKGLQERKGIPRLISNLRRRKKTSYDYAYTSHTHVTGIVSGMRRLGILKIGRHVGRESTSVFHRFSNNKLRLLSFRLFYTSYRYLDLLICQTDFMKEQFCANMPALAERIKVTVLQNPVDKTEIGYKSSWQPSLSDLPEQYIVAAGRLIPQKGFDLLLTAFQQISDRFPAMQLLILGDGPDRGQLEAQAIQLGIADKVRMPGRVDNVYPFFRQAAACVVSSRIEGFPNVLLQMMSQNTNVASTTCAGGIDRIPGIVLIPVDDTERLATALLYILSYTEQEKEERGRLFRDYLDRNDISSYVQQVAQLANNQIIHE